MLFRPVSPQYFSILPSTSLDLPEFLKLLGGIKLQYLLAALLVIVLNSLLRAFRWRTLLVRDHSGRLTPMSTGQ
jgi:uncharacterized membrane protein YbhN (UPF0104 family)